MYIKIIFCLQYYEQYDTLNKKWQISNVKNKQFIHYDNAFPASSLAHCLINSANEGSNVKETYISDTKVSPKMWSDKA